MRPEHEEGRKAAEVDAIGAPPIRHSDLILPWNSQDLGCTPRPLARFTQSRIPRKPDASPAGSRCSRGDEGRSWVLRRFLAPTSRAESAALPASNDADRRQRQGCRRSVSTTSRATIDARAPTRMTHPFATTLSTTPRPPGSDSPNGVLQLVRPQILLSAEADWRPWNTVDPAGVTNQQGVHFP